MLVNIPNIDRKAALLAGHELPAQPKMSVTSDQAGESWHMIVSYLQVHDDGSATCTLPLREPTVAGLIAACHEAQARDEAGWQAVTAEAEAALAAYAAAMQAPLPARADLPVRDPTGTHIYGYVQGVLAPSMPWPSAYDIRVTPARREDPVFGRLKAAAGALAARVESENRAIADAARPALQQAWEERQAIAAAAAKQEAAEKAQRAVERAARRLQTGFWERETRPYNDRRYGAPWCARVTGVKARTELVYKWGDSTARHGDSGLLRVRCAPGEIVAWGQKDLRKPSNSEHHLLLMAEDGSMSVIDRTDAFRRLSAPSTREG
jgi:hypothetical protein